MSSNCLPKSGCASREDSSRKMNAKLRATFASDPLGGDVVRELMYQARNLEFAGLMSVTETFLKSFAKHISLAINTYAIFVVCIFSGVFGVS